MKTAVLALTMMLAGAWSAEARQAASHKLAPLKVEGAKRFTPDDLAKLSGLRVGQIIAVAELQAATDRLAASGLFTHLKYRYVTSASELTVTFEVEEAPSTVPVIFDNFVGFADEEIAAAVRKDVPAFDGTLPDTQGAPDLVVKSLQALLAARGRPGMVAMTPHSDLKTGATRYLFSVNNPAPLICDVSVASASANIQREALDAAKSLSRETYSKFYLAEMSRGTLLDIYRRHARLRAAIVPVASASGRPDCAGADVVFRVDEGPAYNWAGAVWTGNAVAPTSDLDKLLGMRAGELADDSKVRAGLRRVTGAYGRNGFVLFSAAHSYRLDDVSKTAVAEFVVDEGPQFRMGSLQLVGLPDAEANALRKRWSLAAGAVFDDSYPVTFLVKEVSPRRPQAKSPDIEVAIDRAARVANVRLIFK